MKKKYCLLILSVLFLSLSGCNKSSEEASHTTKKVTYYDIETGVGVERSIDFFDDNPYVCYIPIENFKNYFPYFTMGVKRSGSTYTFRNLLNNSKAYLNADTGELTYDSFSVFTSYSTVPHVEIVTNALNFQIVEEESSFVQGKTKFKINLSDYNLKPRKDGNNYYLPIDILTLIDPLSNKGTAYYDGDKTVTMLISSTIYDYTGNIVKTYPKTFYEYCYNTFAFNVDLVYGLNGYSRPLRSDNYRRHTFNKNGAKNWDSTYKEAIGNAKTLEEFDLAFDKIFEELQDGGHTTIDKVSLATDTSKLDPSFKKHKEYDHTGTRISDEYSARIAAGEEQKHEYILPTFDTNADGKDDIGYIAIDEFSTLGSQAMQTVLVEANRLFNKKNNNSKFEDSAYIKDVVIDLGHNGGGATGAEGMLLSWICGGKAKQVLKDARDDSVTTVTVKYDVNKDGSFNEEDYLPSDVNVYILTDGTYSAASALAFDTYMYTLSDAYKSAKKNIKFIGQSHQGGACSITSTIVSPTGLEYHMSSNSVGINWYDQQLTADEVMPVAEGWSMNIEQIVDRTGYINPKIVEQRSENYEKN